MKIIIKVICYLLNQMNKLCVVILLTGVWMSWSSKHHLEKVHTILIKVKNFTSFTTSDTSIFTQQINVMQYYES